MKKKLSLLLAVVMVLSSVIPMTVFAAGDTAISFETTFTEDMTVGDTFTVTASLANNPGLASIVLSLGWNEDALAFKGFDAYEDEFPVSEVLEARGWTVVTNHELGIIVASRTSDNSTNGTLFTANFEIVGSGDLNIVLKDTDASEFLLKNAEATASYSSDVIDYSALEGLSVAGGDEGAAIPDGAPFTAITTDAGAAIAIEQQEDVNGAPYYIVTIPEDATTAYVTAPDQVVMEDYNTGTMKATAYAADVENGWNQLYISYDYEDTTDGPKVEIPMNMVAQDWSGEVELCFVEDEDGNLSHAFGIEDSSYACLGWISFRYGEAGGEEEEIYSITIDENMVGGTLTASNENGDPITEAAAGDYVFVTITPAEGYTGNSYTINGELANDVIFQMPAEDVVLSATFTEVHTCTYEKEVVADKYLKSEATCQTGAVYYKSCECGKFVSGETAATFISGEAVDHKYENGQCIWCQAAEPSGYTVAMSADVETVVGATISIPVTVGHTNDNVENYNAFDMTFAYDPDVLTLTSTAIEGMTVTDNSGTVHVQRYGSDLSVGDTALTLSFKAIAVGEADVELTSAKVDISDSALTNDAPDASVIDSKTQVTVAGYTVNLPIEFEGESTVAPGENYTFAAKDKNYDYVVTAKIGNDEIDVTDNGDGTFTILAEEITGNIVITTTKEGKTFDVTLGDDMAGETSAQYMTPYTATLTKEAGYGYQITVTIGGEAYTGFEAKDNGDGTVTYTIPGAAITGDIVFASGKEAGDFTVAVEGTGAGDVTYEATAEGGKPYSFKLNKVDGYTYEITATMGGEKVELTEAEDTYTIAKVTGNIVITVEGTSDLDVEVKEYVTLNGKTMFLVTATQTLAEDEALSYDGNVMFWSEQYAAWAYLVITDGTLTEEEAKAEITVSKAEFTALEQTYNVNETTNDTVDINDAQLVYDMYNSKYQDFTSATMQKFLKADVNGDKSINVDDAAAIVAEIVRTK